MSLRDRDTLEGALVIGQALEHVGERARALGTDLARRGVRRVILVGSGSSYHAAAFAAFLGSRAVPEMGMVAVSAGTFRHFPIPVSGDDAIVAISGSGSTRDIVSAFQELQTLARKVAVVCREGSPITRLVDECLVGLPLPAHSTTQSWPQLTTLALGLSAGLVEAVGGCFPSLQTAAEEAVAAARADYAPAEDAAPLANCSQLLLVAGGATFHAAQECALHLKELIGLPAEAVDCWELAHGARGSIGPRTGLVGLVDPGAAGEATRAAVQESAAAGSPTVLLGSGEGASAALPSISEEGLAGLVLFAPFLKLAAALARILGIDPDRDRWVPGYQRQLLP